MFQQNCRCITEWWGLIISWGTLLVLPVSNNKDKTTLVLKEVNNTGAGLVWRGMYSDKPAQETLWSTFLMVMGLGQLPQYSLDWQCNNGIAHLHLHNGSILQAPVKAEFHFLGNLRKWKDVSVVGAIEMLRELDEQSKGICHLWGVFRFALDYIGHLTSIEPPGCLCCSNNVGNDIKLMVEDQDGSDGYAVISPVTDIHSECSLLYSGSIERGPFANCWDVSVLEHWKHILV